MHEGSDYAQLDVDSNAYSCISPSCKSNEQVNLNQLGMLGPILIQVCIFKRIFL